MSKIVGGCISQFQNDPDNFELLLAYSDGKEIGHTITRTGALRLASDMANELHGGISADLLEVLREATLALDGFAKGEGVTKPIEQTIRAALAAIAKAEGRS